MRASGLSKAIARNSTGEMSTWPSWSYRILLHRFGGKDQDQWLLVIAFAVEQRVLELQPDPLLAHRAFEQIPRYRGVLQARDLVIAVRARRDIPELTGWTDGHQLRRDVSAVHALGALLVLNDGRLGPLGVPVLPQHPPDLLEAVRGKLEERVLLLVPVRAVPRAVRVNLDRRMSPKVPAQAGRPPQVVRWISWVVFDG